jgi:hypothetical protein
MIAVARDGADYGADRFWQCGPACRLRLSVAAAQQRLPAMLAAAERMRSLL